MKRSVASRRSAIHFMPFTFTLHFNNFTTVADNFMPKEDSGHILHTPLCIRVLFDLVCLPWYDLRSHFSGRWPLTNSIKLFLLMLVSFPMSIQSE
jgi:hypothetical protein